MSDTTYVVEAPAIEIKHGKIFEGSTLRALVNRITAIWQERWKRSADLKRSQSVSAAENGRSNDLRREQHVCTALMHQ